MTNLCIQIEGYVSPFADQLPKIQTEDLIYIEKFEEDAYGHWLFGVSSSSLVDKVNSRLLTVQAGTPIYEENCVKISAIIGNALLSDLSDTAMEYTVSALVLPSNTQINMIVGALGSSTDAKGSGVYLSTNKAYLTSRTGISSLDAGATLDPAKPVFVSLSINKTTGFANMLVLQNGVTYEKTQSLGAVVAATAALGFGNSRYIGTHSSGTNNIYEGLVHNKALSIAEMKAVANRAKVRQANRGIVF